MPLDHLFWLTTQPDAWAQHLQDNGLRASAGREHPSLHARNRLLLFAEHYVEWLCVDEHSPSDTFGWRERLYGGGCRLGLALRGAPTNPLEWTVVEQADYPETRLWLAKATVENPDLPSLFALEMRDGSSSPTPQEQGFPRQLWQHPNGISEVVAVELGQHKRMSSREQALFEDVANFVRWSTDNQHGVRIRLGTTCRPFYLKFDSLELIAANAE